MNHEMKLRQAGLNIVKDLVKELPRSLNRVSRDKFKKNTLKILVERKEILHYEQGVFVVPTEITQILENGMLEDYMVQTLPEGNSKAKLGLITFDVGSFIIGIVRINPQSSDYKEDFFLLIKEGNDYLNLAVSGLFERTLDKYVTPIFETKPTLAIKPVKMKITPENINELLNSGEGHFVAISEEQAKEMGIKLGEGSGMKIDEITAKRIEQKLINLEGVNIEIRE